MKNKELFLITTYAPDSLRRGMLRDFINSINKDLFDIMVVSHSSIPEDIIDNINYFIYDSKNDLLTDVEFKYTMFYNADSFKVVSTENRPFNHTLAALKLVTLGLSTARNEGYEKVHCIEYDTELQSDQEFIENSQLLEEHSLVYYSTNYIPSLISFPVSFNLNKINPQWFEFDEEYLKNWIANDPYKTIENYEFQLIGNEKAYSKPHTNLRSNGVLINLYYSGGEDIWVTPVVDSNNDLFIFSWNKIQTFDLENIPNYDVKIITKSGKGQRYLTWDTLLNTWHLKPIGNFEKIDSLIIIRNNTKIIEYDFNKIDKSTFKKSNYILSANE